jgi:hypothetical protein
MSIRKDSTQGQTFTWDKETALGTPAAAPVYFLPDEFGFPTEVVQTYRPESGGHINPATQNKVISFKDGHVLDGTLGLTVRRATTTLVPTAAQFLEAGGWTRAALTGATTVKTGTTTADLIFTADVGAENGSMVLVETTDDRFEPVFCAAWTVGTTSAVPLFLMSADPTDDDAIEQMHTLYPQATVLSATEALTLVHQSRVEDGAGNPQEFTYKGCAFVLKEITITPGEKVMFNFDVLIADASVDDGTWVLETDHEVAGDVFTGNDFEFLIEDAVAAGAGGAARTRMQIKSVTISTGVSVQRQTSVGGGTDVNQVGGYTCVIDPEGPTWTINGYFDISRINDIISEFAGGTGTNPDVALMASWATQDQALYPALAIVSPKTNLKNCPTTLLKDTDSGLVEMTLMFTANAANLNEADARADLGKAEDAGSQAIYIGISGTGP